MIEINDKYCKGCEICVDYCPMKVFERSLEPSERGYFVPKVKHPERCTALKAEKIVKKEVCRLCEKLCPDQAIRIEEDC